MSRLSNICAVLFGRGYVNSGRRGSRMSPARPQTAEAAPYIPDDSESRPPLYFGSQDNAMQEFTQFLPDGVTLDYAKGRYEQTYTFINDANGKSATLHVPHDRNFAPVITQNGRAIESSRDINVMAETMGKALQ